MSIPAVFVAGSDRDREVRVPDPPPRRLETATNWYRLLIVWHHDLDEGTRTAIYVPTSPPDDGDGVSEPRREPDAPLTVGALGDAT